MAPPRCHLSGTQMSNTGPAWPSCLYQADDNSEKKKKKKKKILKSNLDGCPLHFLCTLRVKKYFNLYHAKFSSDLGLQKGYP